MASIQQSVNSLFNSALEASITGSHAFRQSSTGQRMTAARRQEAELQNINKVLASYAPEGKISSTAAEKELQEIQRLGRQGEKGVLNYAALTGDAERARAGLETSSRLTAAVEERRAENARKQQATSSILSPSDLASGAAAQSIAEEIMKKFGRGGI